MSLLSQWPHFPVRRQDHHYHRYSLSPLLPGGYDYIFPHGATALSGPGSPHDRGFTFTLGHTTLGRTPLEEWSARRRDLYLSIQNTRDRHLYPRRDSNPQFHQASDRRPTPLGSAFTVLYTCMYICVCVCVCVCIYIYIYIYMRQTVFLLGYIILEIICIYNLCYM